jgi:putative ABC transport system permease protein
MKYLPLILAGLWRKPARTIFTFLSIMIAFILFGILSAMRTGMQHELEVARLDRIFTDSRYGTMMPLAYREKIAAIPGVTVVAPRRGLPGYFRDPKNGVFPIMTTDAFLKARPEIEVTRQQIEAWRRTRTGAIITNGLARKYGWKAGDKVTLISNVPTRDGGHSWTFDIIAVVEDVDYPGVATFFLGNYDYLNERRVTEKNTSDRFLLRINDPTRALQIGRAIDALFSNSPAPTRTSSDKAQAQSDIQELGDVGFFTHAVVGAVLFMLLFLTGNTMMQSVRERVPEFAVLKTLGYSDGGVMSLILAESVLLCVLAGLVGLGAAKLAVPVLKTLAPDVAAILLMPWSAVVIGFGFALLVAFLSGLFPALRIKRLNVVDALAGR